ncbi:MAG: hypothetical protein ACOY90_03250 [Candidatus Zhuqueibacterota bacterium]
MIKVINNLLLKVGPDGEIIIEQIHPTGQKRITEKVQIPKADIDLVISYLENAREDIS